MTRIKIWCGGWVIRDGVYPDFATGDALTTAFEFSFVEGFRILDEPAAMAVSALNDPDADFCITGRVAWVSSELNVVDTGRVRIHRRLPSRGGESPLRVGNFVQGRIAVGLSPWIDEPFLLDVPPKLSPIYQTRVDGIWRRRGEPRSKARPSRIHPEPGSLTKLNFVSSELVDGIDALLLELAILT